MTKPIPEEFSYLKDYDIQKIIDRYAKKYKNKKVVIYGAGKLSDYIFNNYDLSKLNIVAVADCKYTEEKGVFHNYNGIYYSEMNNLEFDVVIIFTKICKNIIERLYDFAPCVKNKSHIKFEWILYGNIWYFLNKKIKSLFYKKEIRNNKYIFTFWEPKEKIPPYIKLCMNTWKKYLPDYKIVLLDYSNLEEWLGFQYFDEYLYDNFSLPKQADAIRIALLSKYGGVWMDTDTIITSDKAKEFMNQNSDVTMFNLHLGFIVAKKGARFIKLWLKEIKRRIFFYKTYIYFKNILKYVYPVILEGKLFSAIFFGNSIINQLHLDMNKNEFLSLNRIKYFTLPENNYYTNGKVSALQKYQDFYFNNDFSDYVFENEKGLIMLHNSWTPSKYKNMTEEEFLNQNFTLARVLKRYNDTED